MGRINLSTDVQGALRHRSVSRNRQRGFLMNPARFAAPAPEPPTWSQIKSLLHFDTDSTDQKGVAWTTTAATTVRSDWSSPIAGALGVLRHDDNGSFITTSASADWDVVSSGFTWEGWIMLWETATSGRRIFSTGGGAIAWNSTNGIAVLCQAYGNPASGISVTIGNNTASPTAGHSVSGFYRDAWFYLSVSWNPTLGKIYIGLNGTVTSNAGQITDFATPSSTPYLSYGVIAAGDSSYDNKWKGVFDEVRFSKGCAYRVSDYTSPTTRFPDS